jgi:electron transport complex protein RnfE
MKYIPAFLDVSWHRTTFILPLFGLCTLLGTTDTLALAISTALIVLLCATLSTVLLSTFSRISGYSINHLIWLICAGSLIATIEMLTHAWYYNLYKELGLFLPLIVLLPLLLARHELQLNTYPLHHSLIQAIKMGLGYGLAAVVLGAGRELVSHGSLFYDAGSLWGEWASALKLTVFNPDMGFTLAELAPGSFIALGIGIAMYNWLQLKWHTRKSAKS